MLISTTDFRVGDRVKIINPDFADMPVWTIPIYTVISADKEIVYLDWESYNIYWENQGFSHLIIKDSKNLKKGAIFYSTSLQLVSRPHQQLKFLDD